MDFLTRGKVIVWDAYLEEVILLGVLYYHRVYQHVDTATLLISRADYRSDKPYMYCPAINQNHA